MNAARKLATLGSSRAVKPLIGALSDKDDEVLRWMAAESLGKLGNGRAVAPLVAALKDEHRYVRNHAATALENLGWKPECADQRALFAVAKGAYDRAAAEGPVAASFFAIVFKDYDKEERKKAVKALRTTEDQWAVEPLALALEDSNSEVQEEAVKALGELGGRTACDLLLATLTQGIGDVRKCAAEALGRLRDRRAVRPLMAALKHSDWTVACVAAEALGEVGDAQAIDPLIEVLDHERSWVQEAAAKALGKLGDERVFEPLISAAIKSKYVAACAAEAAAQFDRGRVVDRLTTAIGGADRDGRKNAAVALATIGWKPETTEERAWVAIATGTFEEMASLGAAAFHPFVAELMASVSDHGRSKEAIRELQKLLETRAQDMSVEELQSLSGLPKVVTTSSSYINWDSERTEESKEEADCSVVIQLARHELIRGRHA